MKTTASLFGALICLVSHSFSNGIADPAPNEYLLLSNSTEKALIISHGSKKTVFLIDTIALTDKIVDFPNRFFNKLNSKTAALNDRLVSQTEKYLQKINKREAKLKRKLSAFDSAAAKTLFSVDPSRQYGLIEQKMKSDSASAAAVLVSGDYFANTDSLQTALSFFSKNPKLLNNPDAGPELQNSLKKLRVLENKMQSADQLKQLIEQRKDQIRQYLSKYTKLSADITKIYQDYNKQLYYYQQQVKEYKDMLNDPDKMMRKIISLAGKIPAFSNFMKKNSMLAGLFDLHGDYNPSLPGQGMPTRDMVMSAFQSQSGLSSQKLTGIVQQNVESASGQADELKDRLSGFGLGGGSNMDNPNFRPSSQKTKSFFKRIELGTDIQTVRSNYFFPATTDIGLSLGYKLNDNNVIGIGGSYKIGWGQGFDHIQMTSQGIGIRSFVDIQIRKNTFISGGFEYNHQNAFNNISQIQKPDDWQKSGLLGIGKIVSLKGPAVKKTKIQLLWDFLSYQQKPRTQAFIFRVGYIF